MHLDLHPLLVSHAAMLCNKASMGHMQTCRSLAAVNTSKYLVDNNHSRHNKHNHKR